MKIKLKKKHAKRIRKALCKALRHARNKVPWSAGIAMDVGKA